MEGLHTVKALLRENNWMAKVDLKDAFFIVPIAPQSLQLLHFKMGRKAYQFSSRVCSPKDLYKDSQAIYRNAQVLGYLAGNLHGRHAIYGKLQAGTNRAGPAVHVPSAGSGLYYQHQKVYPESMSGNRISGDNGKFSDNGDETGEKIRQEACHLLSLKQPSFQLLSQLLGKLNATTPACHGSPILSLLQIS